MKRIGEFAKDNSITVRTLRHYEKLGLIKPDHIDPFTGYRYYENSQSHRIRTIIVLKGLGFTLAEISDLILRTINRDQFLRSLSYKLTQARMDLENAQARKLGLETISERVQRSAIQTINLEEINAMSRKNIQDRIPNNELFKETIQSAFKDAKSNGTELSAIVFDLDKLAHINETYGLTAGDEVLNRVVDLINENLPATGKMGIEKSWLKRCGGDEFCVILEGGSSESAKEIAEIISNSLSATDFSHVGMNEKASVSIGISDLSSGARHAVELMCFAEVALVDAKLTKRPSIRIYVA